MTARLETYSQVPLGFETVIEDNQSKTWNLWWNVKLSDDPESWDNEIELINNMQARLDELTDDERLTRAQMAEFCRLNPSFPESIEIICKEIGDGHFSGRVTMGCEGRGLLDSLGHESPKDEWRGILEEYSRSLERWLAQSRPQNPREYKVSGFLGEPTDDKEDFVSRLISVLGDEEPSISSLRKLVENTCRETHSEFGTFVDRPFNCFSCQVGWSEGTSIPDCPCNWTMFLDAGLLCAGTSGEKRSIFDEFRRFTEENTLVYTAKVNSWLTEVPSQDISSVLSARYVPEGAESEVAERIRSYLGEKDEVKEWLMACLLKTVKDNQRWHKRSELIDDFPEASSWFQEHPSRSTSH